MALHLTSSKLKSFKSAVYPSTAMDETDDGILWNGSEEDAKVRSECEKDEGTDYEDGDSDTK
jgi:hypothetical protein